MEEIWKDIKGYEGLYQVSNLGRVRSLRDNHKNKRIKTLKPCNRGNYLGVCLMKENRRKCHLIHRLVAIHFIENKSNLPCVNHKDENKINNHVSNLEWCNQKYNANYGTRNERVSKSHKGKTLPEETKRKISKTNKELFKGDKNPSARKIICITTREIFNTIRVASGKYNVSCGNIVNCCKGKYKSAGKHPITGEKLIWRYYED